MPQAAAQALGVHDLIEFDLGDYPLHLTQEDKFRLVEVIRKVQPSFMLSHSQYDPYNTDHMYATQVALECLMEMNVPGSLAKCLRILMHVNTDRPLAEIKHVYLRGARVLRRDLVGDEEPQP